MVKTTPIFPVVGTTLTAQVTIENDKLPVFNVFPLSVGDHYEKWPDKKSHLYHLENLIQYDGPEAEYVTRVHAHYSAVGLK